MNWVGWLCRLTAAAAIAGAVAGACRADRVVTRSGQEFVGTITEEDAEKVVIRTMSGPVTIPRSSVKSLEKEGEASAPKIAPVRVEPEQAGQAFEDAKKAVAAGDWVRAGSLLEGLMRLDAAAFGPEQRRAATGALVTCYLHVQDAAGAALNFKRRAALAGAESDKKRLQAAAEALEASGKPAIDGKTVATYEEAVEAAMNWKAAQILEKAKEIAAKATGLDEMDRIERTLATATERLKEANVYVPGFTDQRPKDILLAVAANILDGARRAVDTCTEERKDFLSRYWQTGGASIKHAQAYNEVAARYLKRRQQAEDGLQNLIALASKHQAPDLYKPDEVTPLLAKLDDLKYHEMKAGMRERYKIELRRIGGTGFSDR